MYYSHKAYLNAKGGPAVMLLTHDVKRCLTESKSKSGVVNIISTLGTTGLCLLENDTKLQNEYLHYILQNINKHFESTASDAKSQSKLSQELEKSRRSHSGADKFHLMAAQVGSVLTLAFDGGKLLSSPFHDVVVLDFEPKPGRREFVITVMGAGGSPGDKA